MTGLFDFDASRWSSQVNTLNRRLGIEASAGMREQSRLFIEHVIGLTPPHSLKEGQIRTRADIAKAVKAFNVDTFRSERLEEIVDRRDFRAFEEYMQWVDNDALKNATAVAFSDDLHQSVRASRGRVLRNNMKRFVLGAGDRAKLAAYVKKKLANVGLAKSGWVVAMWATGGTAAAWITRHLQRGQSDVVNRLDDPEDPSLTAINRSPWANNRGEGERILRNALRARVNAMESFMKRALARAAEAAGVDART